MASRGRRPFADACAINRRKPAYDSTAFSLGVGWTGRGCARVSGAASRPMHSHLQRPRRRPTPAGPASSGRPRAALGPGDGNGDSRDDRSGDKCGLDISDPPRPARYCGESGSGRQQEGVVPSRRTFFQHLVSHASQPARSSEDEVVHRVLARIFRFQGIGRNYLGATRSLLWRPPRGPVRSREHFRLRYCLR